RLLCPSGRCAAWPVGGGRARRRADRALQSREERRDQQLCTRRPRARREGDLPDLETRLRAGRAERCGAGAARCRDAEGEGVLPFGSTLTAGALCDALCLAAKNLRGFDLATLTQTHPSGATAELVKKYTAVDAESHGSIHKSVSILSIRVSSALWRRRRVPRMRRTLTDRAEIRDDPLEPHYTRSIETAVDEDSVSAG